MKRTVRKQSWKSFGHGSVLQLDDWMTLAKTGTDGSNIFATRREERISIVLLDM